MISVYFLYPYTSNKTRHNYYITNKTWGPWATSLTCNDVQLNQVRLIPISEQHTLPNVMGYSKIKMLDLLNSHHFAFIQLSKIATSSFFRVVFFIIKKLNSTGWISQIIARYSFRRFFSLSFKINSLPPLVLHSRIIRLYDLNLLFSIHVIRYEKTPSQMALSVTHGLQYEKSSLFHRCIYVNTNVVYFYYRDAFLGVSSFFFLDSLHLVWRSWYKQTCNFDWLECCNINFTPHIVTPLFFM